MSTRRLLALVAVGFVVVAAACGDDAATTTTESTTPPTTTTTAPTTTTVPPTTVPPTTVAPTTVPPTTTTVPSTTSSQAGTEVDAATAAGVQAAVAAGSQVTTGRMEGFAEIVGLAGASPVPNVRFGFTGAFDNTVPATLFVMDFSELVAVAGDEIPPGFEEPFSEMELRQIGDTAYMRFPFFSEFLGVPTEWISFPADTTDPAQDLVGGTPGNPAEVLGAFEDAGATVLDAGPDPIRGFDTHHYVLVFDVEELVATADPDELDIIEEMGPLGLDEFALDVWLDPDGLLHRFEMTFDGAAMGEVIEDSSFERMVMRWDIFDHGLPVEIEPPPPDQVTDGEGLGLFG